MCMLEAVLVLQTEKAQLLRDTQRKVTRTGSKQLHSDLFSADSLEDAINGTPLHGQS